MPLFFFHVQAGCETFVDDEGSEIDSLDEAREVAIKVAREILAEAADVGVEVKHYIFSVTNEEPSATASVVLPICMGGVMSDASPSLVPSFDMTVYLVLDDFGKLGRSYLETDEDKADLETVIRNMLAGEYRKPVRVVAFNTGEFWSRDVSEDVSWEVIKRAVDTGTRLPDATHNFVASYLGEQVALQAESALI